MRNSIFSKICLNYYMTFVFSISISTLPSVSWTMAIHKLQNLEGALWISEFQFLVTLQMRKQLLRFHTDSEKFWYRIEWISYLLLRLKRLAGVEINQTLGQSRTKSSYKYFNILSSKPGGTPSII